MSAQHTPGPWVSTGFDYEPEAGWFIRESGDGQCLAVARVASSMRSRDEIEANARLIATAPELLEALAWFINDIDDTHTIMVEFDANVERARKAIAKATGGAA